MRLSRIVFLGCLLVCWLQPGTTIVLAETTAEEVRAQAEKAVEIRRENQLMADEWSREKELLLKDMENLTRELKVTAYKSGKNDDYLQDLETKVGRLELERAKVREIYDQLEPLLDEYTARLTEEIEKDLPYQKEKRLARVDLVKKNLVNYDAGLTEKARRFLETLRVETEFGHAIEVDEGEISIDGALTRVRVLHVGRLAVFVLSRDGDKAWRWDPEENGYVSIDPYARQVGQAIDLAEKNRVVGLVELPLGRLRAREVER